MLTVAHKLTNLMNKLRALPEDRQRLALTALADIVEDFYALDDAVHTDTD
jgi:hypothetical protein